MSDLDNKAHAHSTTSYAWNTPDLRQQLPESWLMRTPLRPEFNQAGTRTKAQGQKRNSNMVEQEKASPELRPHDVQSLSVLRRSFEQRWQTERRQASREAEKDYEQTNHNEKESKENQRDFPRNERSR